MKLVLILSIFVIVVCSSLADHRSSRSVKCTCKNKDDSVVKIPPDDSKDKKNQDGDQGEKDPEGESFDEILPDDNSEENSNNEDERSDNSENSKENKSESEENSDKNTEGSGSKSNDDENSKGTNTIESTIDHGVITLQSLKDTVSKVIDELKTVHEAEAVHGERSSSRLEVNPENQPAWKMPWFEAQKPRTVKARHLGRRFQLG